jgi:hypothetical protein
MSEYKEIINTKELIETKSNLQKLKIILEKDLNDELQRLVSLKEDLPHLLHIERMKKIQREKNE